MSKHLPSPEEIWGGFTQQAFADLYDMRKYNAKSFRQSGSESCKLTLKEMEECLSAMEKIQDEFDKELI